jgi:hypothetical protein
MWAASAAGEEARMKVAGDTLTPNRRSIASRTSSAAIESPPTSKNPASADTASPLSAARKMSTRASRTP